MSTVTESAIMNYTTDGWREYVQGKTSLNLENMNLVDENIIGLAEILKENETIRSIDLSDNKITAIGANALADALRINKYIATNPMKDTQVLNFCGNNFGKEGALAIIKAFDETKRSIHCVILGGGNLTDEEFEELKNTPEVKKMEASSHEMRQALYPLGDCIIS